MAIPKIKLYRLDKNYSPDNDTDIRQSGDDEIYPFAEKSLSLQVYEQLVPVEYHDMAVGRATSGGEVEAEMYTPEGGSPDPRTTALTDCTGWCRGRGALRVYVSTDGGSTWSGTVPESYYRVDYTTFAETAAVAGGSVRHLCDALQIVFGDKIYGDTSFVAENAVINKVKIGYSLFTDDITGNAVPSELCVQFGGLYDGTYAGRVGEVSGGSYVWKARGQEDAEPGTPVKAEGNLGFKIRTYPLRQKVALASGAISDFVADYEIEAGGKIEIPTGCEGWILTQSDNRRPRLFEQRGAGNSPHFRELDSSQYTSTIKDNGDGTYGIIFQLSTEFYASEDGYLFPKELFIRYSEELDLMEDIFTPDYLQADGSGDTGALTTLNTAFNKTRRRIYRMALTQGEGYEAGRDLLIQGGQIDLSAIYYDGMGATVVVYENGEQVWPLVGSDSDSSGSGTRTTLSGSVITLREGYTPGAILVSYEEEYALSRAAAGGVNPWAMGWRICGYTKPRTARTFVSSFRSWVGGHLNNSPDIFVGWQEYDGSNDNPLAISHVDSGYVIDYREGAVDFTTPVTTFGYSDLANWPPSGLSASASASQKKKYLNQVYAKFAYYDGIRDVNSGLLREFAVADGSYRYKMFTDPTYAVGGDSAAHTDASDKKWTLRDDTTLPVAFSHNNAYVPTPRHVESGECAIWTSYALKDALPYLVIAPGDRRTISVTAAFSAPTSGADEGDTVTRTGYIVFSPSYAGETQLISQTETAGAAVFSVAKTYGYHDGLWQELSTEVSFADGESPATLPLSDSGFDPAKTIAENIAARQSHTYRTGASCGYDLVFTTGENSLLITAQEK